MTRYPDKPATASDGKAFERLCSKLHLDLMGEDIGLYESALDQLTRGESRAGVEIKHLQNSFNRLHIEIEERTSLQGKWRKSGIYADVPMERYCCGNEEDVWVFDVADLRKRAEATTERYDHPTVRSMVLHKTDALSFYLYRFVLMENGSYTLKRRGFVGYDSAHRFVHYCHCGEYGPFGYNVALTEGKLGTWYCNEHKPQMKPAGAA